MSILAGDSASYFFRGVRSAFPTPTNLGPNTICRAYATDSKTWWSFVAGTWLQEDLTQPIPPPPPPGPTFSQWSCDVGGYITYNLVRAAVKVTVDGTLLPIIGDAVFITIDALLSALFPELLAFDPALATAVADFITGYVTGHISSWIAWIADDVIWSKVHCYVYNGIVAAGGDLAAGIALAGAALATASFAPALALTGIAYLLEHLGITSIADIPLTALIKHYDCSGCAMGGGSNGASSPPAQFDLTVSDGTNRVPFTDLLTVVGGTISGTSPDATLTIPSPPPALTVDDGTTFVHDVDQIDVVGGTVSSPGAGRAQITIPSPSGITVDDSFGHSWPGTTQLDLDASVTSGFGLVGSQPAPHIVAIGAALPDTATILYTLPGSTVFPAATLPAPVGYAARGPAYTGIVLDAVLYKSSPTPAQLFLRYGGFGGTVTYASRRFDDPTGTYFGAAVDPSTNPPTFTANIQIFDAVTSLQRVGVRVQILANGMLLINTMVGDETFSIPIMWETMVWPPVNRDAHFAWADGDTFASALIYVSGVRAYPP